MTPRPASCGLALYRRNGAGPEILLIHPGGPFWARKWTGAWQLPKGRPEPGETPEQTARREFFEEVGIWPPTLLVPLGQLRQAGGKRVEVFTAEGDFDPRQLASQSFSLEWPPHSGHERHFPEVDAARWFSLAAARHEILPSQSPILDWLAAHTA